MKRTLFLIIILSLNLSGYAKCGAYGLTVYPSADIISTNSLFYLSGYARSRNIIDSLNIKYPVYLTSEEGRIELSVIEVNEGMYSLKQAVLKPNAALQPNTIYELKIDNLTEYHSLRKVDPINFTRNTASWTTNSSIDDVSPQFLKPPKFKGFYYQEKGCGPDHFAIYKLKMDNLEASLVKVELQEVLRKDTVVYTYYLMPELNGELKVGRRMCSGEFEFTFDKRHKYQIRFCSYDYSGNSNGRWTEWQAVKNE